MISTNKISISRGVLRTAGSTTRSGAVRVCAHIGAVLFLFAAAETVCAQQLGDGLFARISTAKGDIVVRLEYQRTPLTVCNFVALAEGKMTAARGKRYYDGLNFHRVISKANGDDQDFMIQGGCPLGAGYGDPGYGIRGEFEQNGVKNALKHTRGVLSMARSSAPNTAGSQFFIMHEDSPHLDGSYAGFGCVTEGLDVVDAIASANRDPRNDRPDEDQRMVKVTVDTFGIDYPEPEKLYI